MSRAPEPLRLIVLVAILAFIGLRVNSWIKSQAPPGAPFATGSAEISGRVIDPDNRPIANATVVAESHRPKRSGGAVATDAEGRFVVRKLAAGEFRVEARKNGRLRATFGEIAPGLGETPILIDDGASVSEIVITMWREAALSGRVLDHTGRPSAGCSVNAVPEAGRDLNRADFIAMRSPLSYSRMHSSTRADGVFRLSGLTPGSYVLVAVCGNAKHARTYFPAATTWARATAVVLAAGDERTGLDIRLPEAVRTVTVSGTVAGPNGAPIVAQVGLSMRAASHRTSSDRNGRFAFADVPPDTYWITAQGDSAAGRLWARTALTVGARQPAPVALTLEPGTNFTAHLTREKLHGTADPERTWISLVPTDADSHRWLAPNGFDNSSSGATDGTFTISDVPPGRYYVLVRPESPAWRVESLMCDERDCLDRPIDIAGARGVAARGHLLDGAASIEGRVHVPPAGDRPGWVVVFADDPALRVPPWRLQFARLHSGGRYSIGGLTAGAYRVAAVGSLSPGDWSSPAFLDDLAGDAELVSVGRAERKMLDLSGITPARTGAR